MPEIDLNWWAIVVATIVNMVVGGIWYSSMLFAKPWAKFTGRKMDEMGDGAKSYAITTVGAVLQAVILAHFVAFAAYFYPDKSDLTIGLTTAAWAWIGFVAIPQGVNTVFEGRRKKLWAINVGYFLIVLLINGVILASWH